MTHLLALLSLNVALHGHVAWTRNSLTAFEASTDSLFIASCKFTDAVAKQPAAGHLASLSGFKGDDHSRFAYVTEIDDEERL